MTSMMKRVRSVILALGTAVPAWAQAAPPGGVSVSGNQLLLDGRPWVPHGFYQIAFEQPPTFSDEHRFWKVAAQFYNPGEYANMRAFGADSVRIQVAQPGMDPQDRLSTPEYRQAVLGAIGAARAAGLVVIVSVQDEQQTGEPHPADLPNPATGRAWQQIAPAFAHDRNVVFELFNEPRPQATPANWQAWKAAMEQTIGTVRQAGAENVVVADGLAVGQQLDGAPLLADPLRQVAYASHPYATKFSGAAGQTPGYWDMRFGMFSRRAPVIITEWGLGYFCDPDTPRAAVAFLQYLQGHGIGLEAGTWDWPPAGFRSARYGFPQPQVSSFLPVQVPGQCDRPGFGPGRIIQTWYRTGVPPTAPE